MASEFRRVPSVWIVENSGAVSGVYIGLHSDMLNQDGFRASPPADSERSFRAVSRDLHSQYQGNVVHILHSKALHQVLLQTLD